MQEWISSTMQALQAGDVGTGAMVAVGLLVLFLVIKLLMNTLKAVIIVLVVIVAIAIFLPEANVLDKAKGFTENASEFVKDKVNADNIESLTNQASDMMDKAKEYAK